MPKLNQIIAIANGVKSRAEKRVTELYHKIQKPSLFEGISRTYRSKDDDGEQLPPESKHIQANATDICKQASEIWTELIDVIATQDIANCIASSGITVDGKVIIAEVPVTHLLFLEKKMNDILAFVNALPTLDPASKWEWSDAGNCWKTEEVETTRTKKIPRNHVKYEATKEHPAQVEMFNEDVIVGNWTKVDFSGALPEKHKKECIQRITKLQDAIKQARENANSMEAENQSVGKEIFEYLFKTTAS